MLLCFSTSKSSKILPLPVLDSLPLLDVSSYLYTSRFCGLLEGCVFEGYLFSVLLPSRRYLSFDTLSCSVAIVLFCFFNISPLTHLGILMTGSWFLSLGLLESGVSLNCMFTLLQLIFSTQHFLCCFPMSCIFHMNC